jgi:hypothetical protein
VLLYSGVEVLPVGAAESEVGQAVPDRFGMPAEFGTANCAVYLLDFVRRSLTYFHNCRVFM